MHFDLDDSAPGDQVEARREELEALIEEERQKVLQNKEQLT